MVIWMVYDETGLNRNQDYVSHYQKLASAYGIQVVAVLDTQLERKLMTDEKPLCVLVRTIQPEINRMLEEKKIPVYNSCAVSRICNDKMKTYQYVRERAFCVPSIGFSNCELSEVVSMKEEDIRQIFRQRFSFSHYERQEKKLLEDARDYVIKAVDGHGGSQVFSVCQEREKILAGIGKQDFLIQPMISSGEFSRDLRVYVVGNRQLGTVLRSSSQDFRSNFSRGGLVTRYELQHSQRIAVERIMDAFDFGMAGIDFILDRDEQLIFNEIEDVVGARMLYQCYPEIDIAKEFISYILQQK